MSNEEECPHTETQGVQLVTQVIIGLKFCCIVGRFLPFSSGQTEAIFWGWRNLA